MTNIVRADESVIKRALRAWWVVFGAFAICCYALLTAEPDLLAQGALAMVFQLACWATTLALLSWWQPTGRLRLSDPGVLVLLWGFIYLVFPSIIVFQGGDVPYAASFAPELKFLLFWLHGLFFLGFTVGYLSFCGASVGAIANLDTENLPSGWILLALSLVPLIVGVFSRAITGVSLLPDTTYLQATSSSQSNYLASRSIGGFSYLWFQIYSKATYYIVLMQGIGAGLLLVRAIKRRQGRLRTCILMALVFGASVLGSAGRRTELFLPVAGALIFLDMLIGPLPWKKILPLALVSLGIFTAYGYFRNNRDLELSTSREELFQPFRSGDPNGPLGEFTTMFGKELQLVNVFRNTGSEGLSYLVQSVSFIVPSQLYPEKFDLSPTHDLLTIAMIGKAAYDQGIGMAGTMIGDGYRFSGNAGVLCWSIVLGAAFGSTQRWLFAEVRQGAGAPVLLKAALLAGLYGWTYNVIRTDLSEMIYIFFYDLFVPWVLLSILLSWKKQSIWLRPLTAKKSQQRERLSRYEE